jgi:hypothetical protein
MAVTQITGTRRMFAAMAAGPFGSASPATGPVGGGPC